MSELYLQEFMRFFGIDDEETAKKATVENTKNWDSYRHMEFIVLLEKKFGARFLGEDIVRFRSYQSGLDILMEKGAAL